MLKSVFTSSDLKFLNEKMRYHYPCNKERTKNEGICLRK